MLAPPLVFSRTLKRMATVTLFFCCLLGSISLVHGQTSCELINYMQYSCFSSTSLTLVQLAA